MRTCACTSFRAWPARPAPPTAKVTPLQHQGGVVALGPFRHRAVVIAHLPIAQELHDKQSVRRTDTTLSIGHHFFVWGGANRLQHTSEFISRLDGLVPIRRHQMQPLQVYGSRDAAGASVATIIRPFPLPI